MKSPIKPTTYTPPMLGKIARQVAPMVFTLVLLMVSAVSIYAQGGPETETQEQVIVRSPEEAYRHDAKAYVEAFGGTIDDAAQKLKLQNEVSVLDTRLQEQEPDTFAGLWIEHTPEFKVVVLFTTPNGIDIVRPHVRDSRLAGLVEVRNADRSLAELTTVQEQAVRALQQSGIPFESDIDLLQNQVKLAISDSQQISEVLQIYPTLLDQIEVSEKSIQSQDYSGNWYAGIHLSACTSGFTVTYDGIRYTTTAAHCSYSTATSKCTNTSSISPLSGAIFNGSGCYRWGITDFSAHYAPFGKTLKNWAAESSTTSRIINGSNLNPSVGTQVCKYGRTSGFTCGTITATSTHANNNGPMLSITPYVHINGACGGDSGGPVYNGSTAMGLVKGGPNSMCPGVYYATKLQGLANNDFNILIVP